MSKYWYILILFSLLYGTVQAQQDSLSTDDEIMIETTASGQDADIKYDLTDTPFSQFKKNPLNLNNASFEQLSLFTFLSEIQINNILNYIKTNGKLITVYELQNINTLDLGTIKKLLPYIDLNSNINEFHIPVKNYFTKGQHQFIFLMSKTLENISGYTKDTITGMPYYLGNSSRYYFKYKYTFNDKLSYGIVGDKDPGEEFFKGTQKNGFDFYSAHIAFKTNTIFSNVVLGDYNLKLGQGLVMYSGYGVGKSPLVTMVKKDAEVLKASSSANEVLFLRGLAMDLKIKNIHIIPFVSYRKQDANIVGLDSITNVALEVSTIQTSGLHRTQNEINDKQSVAILKTGSSIYIKKSSYKVGINFLYNQLSSAIVKGNEPYNLYTFQGKQLIQNSVDYSKVWRNLNFFGETAMSNGKGIATLNGVLASLDNRLDAVFLYRNYQKNYQTLQSLAFAEGSMPQNETGYYFGLQARPKSTWVFSGYADFFKFPWLKFSVDAPSIGREYLLQALYKPSKKIELYVRFANKIKQTNAASSETVLPALVNETKNALRFNSIYKYNKNITFKNRAEWSAYKFDKGTMEQGFTAYQEVAYAPLGKPYNIIFRIQYFNTDSYNTRLYAYEADVLGTFSIPAMYGQGTRMYLLAQITALKKIDVWVKLAQTLYQSQSTIGSGHDLINANHKTELKIQVRYRL